MLATAPAAKLGSRWRRSTSCCSSGSRSAVSSAWLNSVDVSGIVRSRLSGTASGSVAADINLASGQPLLSPSMGRSAGLGVVTGRDGMSGCGGDASPGDVIGGELVEGVQSRGEFRRRVGPARCHQGAQDVVVDLGVDVGEQQAVAGEGVAVAARNAFDQAVAGQPGQVVATLVHAGGAVRPAGDQGAGG